jgi:hypothetical protein
MINDHEKLAFLDVVIQPGSTLSTVLTCGFAQEMILGCSLVARRKLNNRNRPATIRSLERVTAGGFALPGVT